MYNLGINKKNPCKSWMLINKLSSRKCDKIRTISKMKVNKESISSAVEIAEVFNDYFATIGPNRASTITAVNHRARILSALQPTETTQA